MAKIGIIGAGLSGLTTIKELVEGGHQVECFEKSASIGGVFGGQGCYDGVVLTVSNYFMAFSDFMPWDEPLGFWTHKEYRAYLERYAAHFRLKSHIRFEHTVLSLERNEPGGWTILAANAEGEQTASHFDYVAICAGQFQEPNRPAFPGLDGFPGPVVHSANFRNIQGWSQLRGKRVLCVGMGESAADIIPEVASIASQTLVSLRRHHLFSSKFIGNSPIDVLQSRYWHSLPALQKAAQVRQLWRDALGSQVPSERLVAAHMIAAGDEPGSVVTKTDRFFTAMAEHDLTVNIGGIDSIDGDAVRFADGTVQRFDGIVLCTGYRFSLPFLAAELRWDDPRDGYLQMFHPQLRERLALVGVVRPQQGGIPLIAELQARYLALLWAGERTLPEDLEGAARRQAARWREEFYETPEVIGLVNGLRYNEQLAELIGCRPPMPQPLRGPRHSAAWVQYWLAHIWPCQYRLVGPGARPEARARWQEAPIEGRPSRLLARMALTYLRSLWRAREPLQRWRPIAP